MDKIMRKCSACKYRRWYGDYNLHICEISGKVVGCHYYCDLPSDIVELYADDVEQKRRIDLESLRKKR